MKSYLKYLHIHFDLLSFRTERDRPNLKQKIYQVLEPGLWEKLITAELEKQRVGCGFQFEGHKINPNADTAVFMRHCKCGNTLKGEILLLRQEVLKITCYVTESGDPEAKCEKRFLREDERLRLGKFMIETGKFNLFYIKFKDS